MRLARVPYFASLHEVAIATSETTDPSTATNHHHVGALAAISTAEARTRVTASSQTTPPPGLIGCLSWVTAAHPKPLTTPRR
jgi:hypothetical protein